MSYKKMIITILMAMFVAIGAANAQQKYALLIGGNYQPGTEIPTGDRWNNGQAMGQNGYDEFWNDTYLMWEMLYNDPISNYSNDNITVLFANGVDYSITYSQVDDRYKSLPNYPAIPSITDNSATKTNVISALDGLVNIQEEDYLFVWIMSNGGNTTPGDNSWSYVYLWDYNPAYPNEGRLYDYELKAKLDLIPAHKKVVIVQAPNSGNFATTLSDESTIVITSSHIDEPAKRANDTPNPENEWWGGIQYHHGEFGYHLYSPLNGEDPGYSGSYGSTTFASANTLNDDVISVDEGFDWEIANNNSSETPAVSDLGVLSAVTSVQYSTLVYGDINEDKEFMGIIGLTAPPATDVIISQGNVTFMKAILYFLDDTRLFNLGSNTGLLKIDKNVSVYGTNSASGLISYSDIQVGVDVTFSGIDGQQWGGIAVANSDLYFERTSFIDCRATLNYIPNLTIIDSDFLRAGLIGKNLSGITEIINSTFGFRNANINR